MVLLDPRAHHNSGPGIEWNCSRLRTSSGSEPTGRSMNGFRWGQCGRDQLPAVVGAIMLGSPCRGVVQELVTVSVQAAGA